MSYHTSRSSFYWKSNLTDKRKDEIIAWVKTLNKEEASMLNDIIEDVKDEEYFNATYEG